MAARWLESFVQDLRFGLRMLGRSPGFTAIAACSLALGIMATTAMYSVIYACVIDPFPYKDVDTLMSVKVADPSQRSWGVYHSVDAFLEIAERNTIFEGTMGSTISDVNWTGAGEPRRLRGNYCTTNTFDIMGVPPLLGRTIYPSDGAPAAVPVAVLGYKFWQREFGGDPSVLGRQMLLNGKMRTVVGVMPPRFMWRGADVYLPLVPRRGQAVEGVHALHLLGRLKPGITEAHAEADLRPIIADLKRQFPSEIPDHWQVRLLSFKETFPSGIRDALWILFGAVGLLLLIACSNVSNLLLSHGAARQREIAVRASLGAGRLRIVRQLLTENLVLALFAGALGVALAFGALRGILALVPPDTIPDEAHVAINMPVLIFTLAVSALTSLLIGLAPALKASVQDLATPLKEAGRGLAGGRGFATFRNALVVAEVALSLVLMVGATLMIRTLVAMQDVDFGYRADQVLTLEVPLTEQRYPTSTKRAAFWMDLLRRIDSLPGVMAAGVNTGLHPLGGWRMTVEVPGAAPDTRPVLFYTTNEGYARAVGIPLVTGRFFTEAETATVQHLALVNQTFTRRYFGSADPVGRAVDIPSLKDEPFKLADDSFRIIGVVRDTLNTGLRGNVMPEVYVPFTIGAMPDALVVRTAMPPMTMANAVRQQVYAIDKDQPIREEMSMATVLDKWVYSGPRFNLVLLSVFAGLGLTLAAVGVYGVISSFVSQQTREIGIRIALGAEFRDVAGMVLSNGIRLIGAGIAVGLLASAAATRLIERQIWNVSPFDPVSFAATSVVLLVVGLIACYWPARRAANVDPITALRQE
ncbi:MAG TPA: ABC transporter permease [Bryobacteraceae bacterium]|nr:ABC transporter permease [Bryobacteraceae bacterium]